MDTKMNLMAKEKENSKLTAKDAFTIFTSLLTATVAIHRMLSDKVSAFILVSLVGCSLCPLQLLLQ